MSRLWALLVALCAAATVLSALVFLAMIRAAQPPISPLAVLALRGLQALVLCAIAAYAGVRFAPRAGLDAPWLRAMAERRDPLRDSAAWPSSPRRSEASPPSR